MSHKHTNSIALPAPSSLSIAGAVHHVALIMTLGEFLVYFIVQAVNKALVWSQKRSTVNNRNNCILYYDNAN